MKEIKKKSIKKNFIYNSLYQIFTILVPIITTPYISRILLADGVGKYSYTYSIVNFFVLFAQLGFSYYAQREIAKVQDDKYKQSIIFYEIMIIKTITVSISLFVYILLCLSGIFGTYTTFMWLWIFLILAQGFDISFLFQGNEDFQKIVIRNLFIKILGIIIIFAFVKSTEDVWIYIVSISLSNLLGAISTWFYLSQYICKVNIKELHPKYHLKPTIQLFIPTIAAVVYSYFDKTLIGVLIKESYIDSSGVIRKIAEVENGNYEQAEKIMKVGSSLLMALGAVMLPRNSKVYADGDSKQLTNNIYMAFNIIFMIGSAIMFGLLAIAPNLIPWFLGKDFDKCIIYLRLFCPLIILLGIDNIFGIQYLLITGREKKYTIAIVTGTILNILLNILLIPKFYGMGAIFASLISEVIIIVIMYFDIKEEISLKIILQKAKNYCISGFIMFVTLTLIQARMSSNMNETMILIFIGAITYICCLLIFKDELLIKLCKEVLNKIKILKK